MLKNENGSILVIVLSFVLVFSLLGVGSIHHSIVQNEIAEKEKASAEAYWIADGFIERGLSKLKTGWDTTNEDGDLGGGKMYNLYFYQPDCAASPNCIFQSQSLVKGQYRTIRATVDNDVFGNLVFTSWDEI